MSKAYVVIIDHEGCKECRSGRTYTIVGPDDVALSESYESLEHTQYIAEQLNAAYEAGKRDANEGLREALHWTTTLLRDVWAGRGFPSQFFGPDGMLAKVERLIESDEQAPTHETRHEG